ncbi:MAG: hypothetical protein KDB80_14575 [Planctomycetes bacterium]|nr:hypothetical protein [Planctomycetota bacterium]
MSPFTRSRIAVAWFAFASTVVGGLAAQPCVQVVVSNNWQQTHRSTQMTATQVAIAVPALAQTETICQVELRCYTRSASPVAMPVWIYDGPGGVPGVALGVTTMTVGTTLADHTAPIQATVPGGTPFFIVFDNAVGNLAPPIALGGTIGMHFVGGPSGWTGPFQTAAWMYQAYSSSGTLEGSFAEIGPGCPGIYGVPRIGVVGMPVTGTVSQVTLSNAPIRTPVQHLLGFAAAPVSLDALGLTGCVLEQNPVASFARLTGSTGAASFAYAIPNNPLLVGLQLHVQWSVLDPTANPLGLSLSPGGIATIGDY